MIQCEYLRESQCEIAGDLAGMPVNVSEPVCLACQKQLKPMAENPVTVAQAIAARRKSGVSIADLAEKVKEPSFLAKIVNFTKAVATDIKDGSRRVSNAVYTARINLCRDCGLYNMKKGTCGHPDCGCVMQRKAKWASQECPIGKWGKQLTEETH